MGNPKGSNAGNVGKKGRSGRHCAYVEEERASKLISAWFDEGIDLKDLEKLKKKLTAQEKKGSILLWELFILRSITNNRGTELTNMFNKIFPDKIKAENTNITTHVVDEHTQKLLDFYKKNDPKK